MTDVLCMAALQVGYPNVIWVLVKACDFAIHRFGTPRELPLPQAGSPPLSRVWTREAS